MTLLPPLLRACLLTGGFVVALLATGCATAPVDAMRAPAHADGRAILVFSRTTGFRHDSIPVAVATLRDLGRAQGLRVDATEDAAVFTPSSLAAYRAIVFANTTGEILDALQRAALEAFVRAGGGYMGIHSAADTEYTSPWYGELVGARFAHHPPGLQTARLTFVDERDHRASWRVTDEFYDYDRNPRDRVQVVATIDEHEYDGGRMGDDHPIAWCHARFGGRAWYTGLGHAPALYGDARYRAHLARGLRYVTRTADEC